MRDVRIRDEEIAKVPVKGGLPGCDARRPERGVAGHISDGQRSSAPGRPLVTGTFAISSSLSSARKGISSIFDSAEILKLIVRAR